MFPVSLFLKDWVIRHTDCICATTAAAAAAGTSVQVCGRVPKHNDASLTSPSERGGGEELVQPVPSSPGARRGFTKRRRRAATLAAGGAEQVIILLQLIGEGNEQIVCSQRDI